MDMIPTVPVRKTGYADDRGVALLMMLLVSFLLLAAGGALLMTTSMTATNTADSAAETAAYYAAEAGAQSVLTVLRGNVAPNPLFAANPAGSIADANRISFRAAVNPATSNTTGDTVAPRLSRWLSYDTTYTDRVTLSSSYSPMTGMAYKATLSDPDNSAQVTFSTSGLFNNNTADKQVLSGNPRVTLTYHPQASTTINTSGASTLGYFEIRNLVGSPNFSGEPFKLTITQTAPWPATYTIDCTLSMAGSTVVVVTFPTLTNNLQGAVYTRLANPVNSNATTPIAVSITAPQPNRLIASITGYGPRSASKQMQMLLSRFAFDYTTASTITLRSADDGSVLTFDAGNSAQYTYSGLDNAGGQNLSAFGVTSTPDYNYLTGLSLPSVQVKGSPSGVQQVSISSLPAWLQTTDGPNGARAFVDERRTTAKSGITLPDGSIQSRYFTTATPPSDFGTNLQPVLTFVDGDVDLPPGGGAGLLVVTGTLTLSGSSQFNGLMLVLGGGRIVRTGGGGDTSLGATFVARFGTTGDFLAPTLNSNGSGNSTIQYDSGWALTALASPGPRVTAIGEF
jgi:hypothetical protein